MYPFGTKTTFFQKTTCVVCFAKLEWRPLGTPDLSSQFSSPLLLMTVIQTTFHLLYLFIFSLDVSMHAKNVNLMLYLPPCDNALHVQPKNGYIYTCKHIYVCVCVCLVWIILSLVINLWTGYYYYMFDQLIIVLYKEMYKCRLFYTFVL